MAAGYAARGNAASLWGWLVCQGCHARDRGIGSVSSGGERCGSEVEGARLEQSTDTLSPGKSADLTVTLPEGTYVGYCPVGDHKERGTETEITVGACRDPPDESPAKGSGY